MKLWCALWNSHNTVTSSPHRHPTYSGAHAGSVPHCRLTVPGARVTSNLGKVERPRRLTAGNAQPSPQWQPLPKVRNLHTEQNRAYLAPLPHWQPSDAVLQRLGPQRNVRNRHGNLVCRCRQRRHVRVERVVQLPQGAYVL